MSRRFRLSVVWALAFSALASEPGHRDVSDLDLGELLNIDVEVGSKTAQRVEDAPGSVTVISRQQIADMNARSLREVLNVYVPGMDVVPTYFRTGDRVNEGIYSRGLLSDMSQQVLVLFNGHTPFNDSTFDSPFAAVQFTLEAVERIEVSRSPIPLLGGGAITVVNIVTRDHQMEGGEGQLEMYANRVEDFVENGNQGKRFTAVLGRTVGDWHVGGAVQYYDDIGSPPTSAVGTAGYALPLESLRDGTRTAANSQLTVNRVDGKLTIQTDFRYADRDSSLNSLVASNRSGPYQYRAEQWTTNIKWAPLEWLELDTGSSFSRWSQVIDLLGTPTGGQTGSYWDYVEATVTHQFHWLGDHSLVAGLKGEVQAQYESHPYQWSASGMVEIEDESKQFAPDQQRLVGGLYAEDNLRLGQVSVLAGFRVDAYSGWNATHYVSFNPRVAVTWTPTSELVFKALFSSAQRPPSLYESAGLNRYPLLGNPDVTPERVQSAELSAIFRRGGLKIQLTPYAERFENKIEYLPTAGGLFLAQNSGIAMVEGVDLDGFYYFTPRTYAFLNLSYVHSTDLTASHVTYFLPSTYVNGGFNWNFGAFDLNVTGYFRSTRPLPPDLVVNQQAMAPSLIVNGSLSWAFHEGLRTFLLVENLTGQQVFIPLARDNALVPLRPRTFHLGLIYSFE